MSGASAAAPAAEPVRWRGNAAGGAGDDADGVLWPFLDVFITNLRPAIRADLHARTSPRSSWVIRGLPDRLRRIADHRRAARRHLWRRQMYALGMAGFVVASVLCGLAPTAATLIAAPRSARDRRGLMFRRSSR